MLKGGLSQQLFGIKMRDKDYGTAANIRTRGSGDFIYSNLLDL